MIKITFNKVVTRFGFLSILFLIVSVSSFSQSADLTLTVAKTDETCSGNGSLTFSVSGAPAGASVSYSIYLHPDLTNDIVTLSGNTYGGLSAGTYRVVADVTINGESISQFVDIEILDLITQLSYGLTGSPAICGDNGQITVNVTQGIAVGYEIISGPEIIPIQASNVFTGLAAGFYEIRVFDACGEGIVQAHTLFESEAGMNISIKNPVAVDCDTIAIGLNINEISAADIAYPITIQCTVFPADGPPIIFNQTIFSGSVSGAIYNEEVPYSEGELLTYEIVVTDSCGNVQEINGSVSGIATVPGIGLFNQTCTSSGIIVSQIVALELISAPDGYPDELPADYTSLIVDNVATFPTMPFGTYQFLATGLCGNVITLVIEVEPAVAPVPGVNVFEGCDAETGTVYIGGIFTEMTLLAAPASFSQNLPMDVSEFIDTQNNGFVMSGLPPGTYTFTSQDACGNDFIRSGTIVGFTQSTVVNVIEHCGAFDLQIAHSSNASGQSTLWLQQLNPITGQWVNPVNGALYVDGTTPNAQNSLQILSNGITYNLDFAGTFRIMIRFPGFVAGVAMITDCYFVVHEFELLGLPKIDEIYSFTCNGGDFDVVVEATGIAPLIYRITSINGNPVNIDNGTVNIFNGLASGIYNFQVEDACQNIVNRVYDISEPFAFAISGLNVCPGESTELSVPDFPFLNYEWIKSGDPSVILSTNGILAFSPFDAADAGTYSVHIWNDDPLSCLDLMLTYSLTAPPVPQSGTSLPQTFCGLPTQIDLFSLLEPPYDLNGQWTTNASGSITGSIWTPGNTDQGTYNFMYSIDGLCDIASTTASITVNEAPAPFSIEGQPNLCEGNDLELEIAGDAGIVYQWQGPNDFTFTGATLSVPNANASMSGVYSVTAVLDECQLPAQSISVTIAPMPLFTITQACDGNASMLQAAATTAIPDLSEYTFNWSGPDGFSAVGNPVNVTGKSTGMYQLEVSTSTECVVSFPVEVVQTVCSIPLGISPNDDGANDVLDLSGLGVVKLQIFNRYGLTIFEKSIYKDEWHGQDYNGNLLPSATYYYLAQLNTGAVRTGWIYLLRD